MPKDNESVTPAPQFSPPDSGREQMSVRERVVAIRRTALNLVARLDELLEELAHEPPGMV